MHYKSHKTHRSSGRNPFKTLKFFFISLSKLKYILNKWNKILFRMHFRTKWLRNCDSCVNIKQFYHILFKRLLTIKIYKPLKLFSNFLFLVWLVTSKYYMSIRHFLFRVWSEIRKKNINIWLEAWKIILNWSNRRDQFILKIFFVYIKCVLFFI